MSRETSSHRRGDSATGMSQTRRRYAEIMIFTQEGPRDMVRANAEMSWEGDRFVKRQMPGAREVSTVWAIPADGPYACPMLRADGARTETASLTSERGWAPGAVHAASLR